MEKKRILVAATPEGQYRAQQALSDSHDLKFVSTLREAQSLLTEVGATAFDMIICGVHFDDSRMFELLQFVRSVDHFDRLPFLIIQAKTSALHLMESVRSAADKLGVGGFLELQDLPPSRANKALQNAVKQSFDRPAKAERRGKPEKTG